MVEFNIKSLVYKELSPAAKAAGLQLLLLDSKTYASYGNELEKKMKSLGIGHGEYRELVDNIDDYGCVAVLKSKTFYTIAQIASMFSKFGLQPQDIGKLDSVADEHQREKGYVSYEQYERKVFFWWFAVVAKNEDGQAMLESVNVEPTKWIVKFYDKEDGKQTSSFGTLKQANDWIAAEENRQKYNPTGFEVLDGPYDANRDKAKLWIDDIRPAPKGYEWLKSVNDFIDYVRKNGIKSILVVDLDHDAGDYQKDGGDYIKCLDYLESIGAKSINIRLHSANPVGVKSMRQIVQKNGWNELHDIIDEDECIEKEDRNGI